MKKKVIYYFDRISMYSPMATKYQLEVLISSKNLAKYSNKLKPIDSTKGIGAILQIFQPTRKLMEELRKVSGFNAFKKYLSYIEITADIIFETKKEAQDLLVKLATSIAPNHMPIFKYEKNYGENFVRDPLLMREKTFYFSQKGQKRKIENSLTGKRKITKRRTLAFYADDAKLLPEKVPCLRFEYRIVGSKTIGNHTGIGYLDSHSLDNLIMFSRKDFIKKQLNTKTKFIKINYDTLGRWLSGETRKPRNDMRDETTRKDDGRRGKNFCKNFNIVNFVQLKMHKKKLLQKARNALIAKGENPSNLSITQYRMNSFGITVKPPKIINKIMTGFNL